MGLAQSDGIVPRVRFPSPPSLLHIAGSSRAGKASFRPARGFFGLARVGERLHGVLEIALIQGP